MSLILELHSKWDFGILRQKYEMHPGKFDAKKTIAAMGVLHNPSKYQFYLPTEKELEAELKREIKEIQRLNNDKSGI